MQQNPKIWDGFIRLFHWSLVGLIAGMWWTAEEGYLDWHLRLGLVLIGLLVARLLWGFWGSESARFSRFLQAPTHAWQHLRELFRAAPAPATSHNAAGGWFVVILLTLLLGQGVTGLFATDDIFFDGPLHDLVSSDVSEVLTDIHKTLIDIIWIAIAIHIAAILIYKWRGRPLTQAMLNGQRREALQANERAPKLVHGGWGVGLSVVLILLLYWWL